MMPQNMMFMKGNKAWLRTWDSRGMCDWELDQEDPEVKKFILHKENPDKWLYKPEDPTPLGRRELYYERSKLNENPK